MSRFKKKYLAFLFQISLIGTISAVPNQSLVGFGNGVTGGEGGTKVTATDGNFATAVEGTEKKIIEITGTIKVGSVKIGSNKTIIGVGKNAEITGTTITMKSGCSNVIIKNLKIHHAPNPGEQKDLISVEGGKKIWIDHCEIYNEIGDLNKNGKLDEGEANSFDNNWYDGSFDVKAGSNDITISWCYFHDAFKTSLIGSSDDSPANANITYHHCVFHSVKSRTPLYRGGIGHIFNCYFNYVYGSGINSRVGANLLIEGNVFENVGTGSVDEVTNVAEGPIGCWYIKDKKNVGYYEVKDNLYTKCFGNQPKDGEGTATNVKSKLGYTYDNVLQPASQVKETLLKYCGTESGVTLTPTNSFMLPLIGSGATKTQPQTKTHANLINTKLSQTKTFYSIRGEKINNKSVISSKANGIYIAKSVDGVRVNTLSAAR